MVSLAVAASSSMCALLFGIVYGGISGYVGGRLDATMMRIVDIAYAMPSTIVALAFQMVFPNKILDSVDHVSPGWNSNRNPHAKIAQ